MRCARWMACISTAGFHHGSIRKTCDAICRLRPCECKIPYKSPCSTQHCVQNRTRHALVYGITSPPALSDSRMISTFGFVLKASSTWHTGAE
jgi:hypothetical protein